MVDFDEMESPRGDRLDAVRVADSILV